MVSLESNTITLLPLLLVYFSIIRSLQADEECLGVYIGIDSSNICYLNDTFAISWSVKSLFNSSLQVSGTENDISCDLTFDFNECVKININHTNYTAISSTNTNPFNGVLFLYNNSQIFSYSPNSNDWGNSEAYDSTTSISINAMTNQVFISHSLCFNNSQSVPASPNPTNMPSIMPTASPTYECVDWPNYVCIQLFYLFIC